MIKLALSTNLVRERFLRSRGRAGVPVLQAPSWSTPFSCCALKPAIRICLPAKPARHDEPAAGPQNRATATAAFVDLLDNRGRDMNGVACIAGMQELPFTDRDECFGLHMRRKAA